MAWYRSKSMRIVTVTVSDTRTEATDESGRALAEELERAGLPRDRHVLVRDEPDEVKRAVEDAVAGGADAVVLSGGTGIAPRDRTYEAVDALLEKRLDGFGEAFRRLSWDEIGPRAVLSRAMAGVLRGGALVFLLPGSPKAVRLGVGRVIAPVLPHAVALARGEGKH